MPNNCHLYCFEQLFYFITTTPSALTMLPLVIVKLFLI